VVENLIKVNEEKSLKFTGKNRGLPYRELISGKNTRVKFNPKAEQCPPELLNLKDQSIFPM
jgi:hypothetical protein